ncbi:MAG: hypothetical protein ABSD59_02410 [Terracidiphilus sp.]
MLTKSQLLHNRVTITAGSPNSIKVHSFCPEMAIQSRGSYANLSTVSGKGLNLSPKNNYPYLGKMYPGNPVPFESTTEPFSQYALADGTTVKAKVILLDAVRLETFDENGNPVYQFQFQQILGIVPPDSLKKKTQ